MTVRDTETLLSEAASHAADMERQVDELVAAAKAVLEMLIDENGENHCRETLALSYAIAKAEGRALTAPAAPKEEA